MMSPRDHHMKAVRAQIDGRHDVRRIVARRRRTFLARRNEERLDVYIQDPATGRWTEQNAVQDFAANTVSLQLMQL